MNVSSSRVLVILGTLDCNGYSIIGPGADIGAGIRVFGNNVIIKNCNVEQFLVGIDNDGFLFSVTVESTTLSNNDIGFVADFGGVVTLKNVLAENNRKGVNYEAVPFDSDNQPSP